MWNAVFLLFDKTMKNEILQTGTITDIEDTDYVWGIDFNHRWDNWFTNYHVIFPLKTIEFEGGQYYCLNNPEAFLKRVYGDYMAYPKKITFGHSMYKKLSEKDWYITSPDGSITIVSSEVAKMSKRMSLFRSVIEVRPTMLDVLNEGTVPGIMVIINRELCGTMLDYEVKAFIDMVNHMDISTYSLLVGLVDKVDQIDDKLDKLLRGLNIR